LDLNLNDQYELRGNTIVARNVTTLLTAIASRLKQGDVVLSVQAHDECSGFTHPNLVRFRIAAR